MAFEMLTRFSRILEGLDDESLRGTLRAMFSDFYAIYPQHTFEADMASWPEISHLPEEKLKAAASELSRLSRLERRDGELTERDPKTGAPLLFKFDEVGTTVERLFREIRALRIYEGTSEIQQLIIADSLLKD